MARPRPERQLADLLGETRRLTRRNKRRLGPNVVAELTAVQAEARSAIGSGDEGRIAMATAALQASADLHLVKLRKGFLREFLEIVVVAVLLALAVRTYGVEAFRIPSGSMIPTLLPGDVVLVDKSAYGLSLPLVGSVWERPQPARGEVVVFESPQHPGETLIKRVAGVAGDTVAIVDETVLVNGEPQARALAADRWEFWNFRDDLRYWHPQSGHLFLEDLGGVRHATVHSRLIPRPRPSEGPFVVPPGHVFVLGDNRDDSDDGRSAGGWYVPLEKVKGRAIAVGFSWGRGGVRLWGDEGVRLARILHPVDGGIPGDPPLPEAAKAWGAEAESEAPPVAEPAGTPTAAQ